MDSVFALLLLAFECRLQSMEPWIRQMFGFLFTYRGRTAFIFMYVAWESNNAITFGLYGLMLLFGVDGR